MTEIKEHMEVIGADGVHVGTVDQVEGGRFKLTKKDSGEDNNAHEEFLRGGVTLTTRSPLNCQWITGQKGRGRHIG